MFGACVAIFITVTTGHNQLLLIDACKIERLVPITTTHYASRTSKCQAIINNNGSFLVDSCAEIEYKIKQALEKAKNEHHG